MQPGKPPDAIHAARFNLGGGPAFGRRRRAHGLGSGSRRLFHWLLCGLLRSLPGRRLRTLHRGLALEVSPPRLYELLALCAVGMRAAMMPEAVPNLDEQRWIGAGQSVKALRPCARMRSGCARRNK